MASLTLIWPQHLRYVGFFLSLTRHHETPNSPHWLRNLAPKFPKLSRGGPLFSSLEVRESEKSRKEEEGQI